MTKKVLLFTKEDCTPCKMTKQFLESEDVQIDEEFDVIKNTDAVSEFSIMSVPTLIYREDNNGYEKIINGFNMPELEKVVKAYKSN